MIYGDGSMVYESLRGVRRTRKKRRKSRRV